MAEGKRSSSATRGKKKKAKSSKETSKEVVVETLENETVELANETEEGQQKTAAENERKDLRNPEASEETQSESLEKSSEPIRARLSDEYLIQCYFDKVQNQFVATVLEFGSIKATGSSKADVIRDCENRLESHLNLMKRQGENTPESFQTRSYPERLQVPISQGLYRRLDLLSRQEKTSLDQLVVELISGMVERRLQVPNKHQQHGGGQRPQQHSHSHSQGHREGHRDSHREGHREGRRDGHREAPREARRENRREFNDEDNIGNLKRDPQPGQNRGNRNRGGRNFHKTMESRENFLEYVRNLEKGNWKKR